MRIAHRSVGDGANGSTVTLKATPTSGSVFKRWSGACDGQGATCRFKITHSTSASAVFDALAPSTPPPSPAPPSAPPALSPFPSAPGQVDRSLEAEAEVVGVRSGQSALGHRLVRVEISADEKISVALVLTRNGHGIVGKRVSALAAGLRVVTLVVPDGVRAGWTRLAVTLADTAGNKQTLTRRVKVGAAAHLRERKR